MALVCTPSALLAGAKCFPCLTPKQLRSVRIRALCVELTSCNTPLAPTSLALVSSPNNPNSTTIAVQWSQPLNIPPDHITSYVIKWGTSSGVYTFSATTSGSATSYTITGLSPNVTYFIVVQAVATACVSATSNELSATTATTCTLSAKTQDWVARILVNTTAVGAAATPSMNTQCAMETFYQGLITDGIDGRMIAVLPYIPDKAAVEPGGNGAIAMARTPFYVGGGADPWQNQSFVAADLSVNGLLGDAATKFLNTLLDPTTMAWTPASDCGMSIYVMDGSSNANWGEMGVNKPSNSAVNVVMFCNLSGTSYGELVGFPTGTPSGAAPNKAGFYGVSRTGANAATLYFGNSTTAFAALGNTAGASGVPPSRNMLVHGLANDDAGGTVNFASGRRISFAAFHKSLTLAQHQALFNRVQALRVALGGGFA